MSDRIDRIVQLIDEGLCESETQHSPEFAPGQAADMSVVPGSARMYGVALSPGRIVQISREMLMEAEEARRMWGLP